MNKDAFRACFRHQLAANRRGAVSVLFATMIVPLILIVGLAVDFGFYVVTASQLNLAADAAAMHAVRAAALATQNGAPSGTCQNGGACSGNTAANYAGVRAGEEWFTAQAGLVPGFVSNSGGPTIESSPQGSPQGLTSVSVVISYNAPTYTATVTYSGTVNLAIIGGPHLLVNLATWPITGTATSQLSYNYVDIAIMIDNSQSMLIGATPADIATMDTLTPCAKVTPYTKIVNGTPTTWYPGLSMWAYSYYMDATTVNGQPNYLSKGTYGYAQENNSQLPVYSTNINYPATECDPNFTAANGGVACGYPPAIIYGANGSLYTTAAQSNTLKIPQGACNNGGGSPGNPGKGTGLVGANTPQAPCALACHENAAGGDYYTLARNNNVTLRLDVVQSAAQQVISTMEQYSPSPNTLLGLGVFTFNENLNPVYPCTSLSSCTSPYGYDLATASSDITPCAGTNTSGCLAPPVTGDTADTYFANVFSQANNVLGTSGDGSTQAKAIKNLFIITDGVNDWNMTGSTPQPVPASVSADPGGLAQLVGPIDQLGPNPCGQLKSQGINIYVLYTPYYPIPTWTYTSRTMPQPGSAYPAGVTYPSGVTLANFANEPNPSTFPNYNASEEPDGTTGVYDTPIMAALRACASSPSNFFTASNQTDINNAMQTMLAAALNSAARVTQ